MSMTEILNKYTAGQTTLEATNAALAEMGAGIHLEPGKNELTAEETAAAKAETAANANGFGLLEPAPARWTRWRSGTAIWWAATAARCTPCA